MSRILHHVGKNDFKKTRQRQIGEQKERAAKELKERQEKEIERKIIEEAAKPFKSDWRNEIQIPEKKLELEDIDSTLRKLLNVTKERGVVSEKMTSSGLLIPSTLHPTGDDINVEVSTSELRYNTGDAVVADGAIRFGEVEPNNYDSNWWSQSAGTNYIKTTTVEGEKQNTHVSFNVDVGTGIDAPLPQHPLVVKYQMRFTYEGQEYNAGTGTLGTITSSGIHSFELPEFHEYFEISFDLRVDGTYLRKYEADYQRRMFVGTTLAGATITEADTVDSIGPAAMIHRVLHHPGPFNDDADSLMHVLLFNGFSSRISGLPGQSGGGLGSDRVYLYNLIRSQYAHLKNRYAKTYTINSLGITRRTPLSVFVALDDPDANAFIRMDGLENLSPEQRKKRLEEMLSAGDDFMVEYLGLKPSTARPVEMGDEIAGYGLRPDGTSGLNNPGDEVYDPATKTKYKLVPRKGYGYNQWVPINKADSSTGDTEVAQGLPYTDEDDAFDNPYYNDPFKDPGDLDDSDDESTWDYAKNSGDTEVAASYPTTNTPLDKVGGFKGIPKGKGLYPMDKDGNLYNPQTGLPIKKAGKEKQTQVAHHELEGDVISEKKKLKNPEEVLKKLPGYYDGKPSPAGFPLSPPIIPVDGQHPELINPVKVANRFNRLDPISAKSMPLTGNPHIDKKVKAARKKPK